MSFWDASFTTPSPGTSTPPPQTAGNHPPTLNEEVTEVIGQLGRFWGGFRKQGQSAIEAARKDLGEYVSQAQQGLNKQLATLSIPTTSPVSDAEAPSPVASSSRGLNDSTTTDGESSGSSSISASTATLADPQQQEEGQQRQEEAQLPTQSQTLFTRLQSSLPPDLLTSIRETIPDSVRHPQARKDLAQAAQAHVQGAATRGEELLRGASVFLRDAVRVVPPEQAAPSSESAFAFASVVPPHAHEGPARTRGKGKAPPFPVAAGTRRGALLYALRANPAILRVDPAKEDRSAAQFVAWVEAEADAIRDESRRESELAANDGLLGNTRSALVPEELSEDEFWTRYFFRVHQVDQEDERRKAVLSAGPPDQDDDFSWEDEDEDGSQKTQSSPQLAAPMLNRDKLLCATTTSGMTSPERSDDSFDIVSSGNVSAAGDAGATRVDRREPSNGDDDGGEEDEEEDDNDDDDDDDDDEDESDWE